ncbi:hypothetical protein PGB90_009568 [Kerria lacca]
MKNSSSIIFFVTVVIAAVMVQEIKGQISMNKIIKFCTTNEKACKRNSLNTFTFTCPEECGANLYERILNCTDINSLCTFISQNRMKSFNCPKECAS